MSDVYVAADCN